MELRGKRILLISPEPWHALHVSKHHMAEALAARGNKVCFWGPPEQNVRGVALRGDDPLRHVHYRHWFRGVNRWPRSVQRWYYGRLIRNIEREAGAPFDIIWCFDVSRMQFFPGDRWLRILHLADHDILYEGQGLMRTADRIFTITGPIREEALKVAPGASVNVLGHAVDDRWLAGADALAGPTARVPHTVAYAGLLTGHYIDWEMLHAVAAAHPELHFHLYGPVVPGFSEPWFLKLHALSHVTFHGRMTKRQLIPALRSADLLLVCYNAEKLGHVVANSHKILEYLSTGNIVVSSFTSEYAGREDLLVMAEARGAYIDRFQQALDRFGELNDPAARERRINFARERSLPRMLDRIESLLP